MIKPTYQEILGKINIPVMNDEGIKTLFNWYLTGKSHPSRCLRLNDYKEPYNGNYDPAAFLHQQATVIYKIIQLIKKDLWQMNYPDIIEKYINCGWFSKNFKLSMAELAKISNAYLAEIQNYLSNDSDNQYSTFLKRIRTACADFNEEHVGDCLSFPYDAKINYQGRFARGYEYRIYLNGPNDDARYEFLSLYIQKCISRGIPFHMKGNGAIASDIDNMILYTNAICLTENIAVLEEIRDERPDLIEKFGSPIASGGNYSYYAITHAGKKGLNGIFNQTYNDYFDYISELAYLSLISEEALEQKKIPYYAYYDIAKEYSLSVNEVYAILVKYQTINPALLDKAHFPKNEIEMVNKLCKSSCEGPDKLNYLTLKYENKIKLIASLYNFGNKDHAAFPVCFDNLFYKYLVAEQCVVSTLNNPGEYHFKTKDIIQDNASNKLN